jgi:hypothetical protein
VGTKPGCVRTVVAAGDMDGTTAPEMTGRLAVRLHPDVVATLGDEQYPAGVLADYRQHYGTTGWGRLKPRTRPVPGNHEYETPGATGYFTYFDHPHPYYAYNIGCGWRGYALNSEVDLATESTWLHRDLAAHPDARALAYWHQPMLSSGVVHGGNSAMIALWRPFEGRPTIVLNGHEHNYERFAPRDDVREFVVGTGGEASYPFGPTPSPGSVKRITNTPGVLLLHLSNGSYTWSFQDTGNKPLDTGSG